MYSPKPANGLSKKPQWTLRFARGLSILERLHFGEISADLGGSKMRGYCLGRILVGVPVVVLGICLSTFHWRFLAVGCEQSPG